MPRVFQLYIYPMPTCLGLSSSDQHPDISVSLDFFLKVITIARTSVKCASNNIYIAASTRRKHRRFQRQMRRLSQRLKALGRLG